MASKSRSGVPGGGCGRSAPRSWSPEASDFRPTPSNVSEVTLVAVIGAGPYGLSIAAHLRALNLPYRIFGSPLDTWRRHMPAGMALKSDGFASSLSDPSGEGTLGAYCANRGIPYHDTDIRVPLDVFTAYALDFQQRFVPDVDERQVVLLERSDGFFLTLDDAEVVGADSVVVATGITHFGQIPPELANLPLELVSHSSAHHDLSAFVGQDITVIGGGSSAVDTAVLVHEAGAAATSLIVRRDYLRFDSPSSPGPRSQWQRIRHPSSGLGPGWRSRLCESAPGLFRFLPTEARLTIVQRHLGPRSPWHMKARLEAGVSVALGESVERAGEEGGRVRLGLRGANGGRSDVLTDHVIAATGYWPDIGRLEFLSEDLRASIRADGRVPVLSRSFESSVDDLYFVGLPAMNSFGPLARFMVGAHYVAPRVARRLVKRSLRAKEPTRATVPA